MRFITLNSDNKVISIRVGKTIVLGEIQSDIGELGQVMQQDGTFVTPEPTNETIETLEDKLDWLILNAKGLI